MWEDKLLIMNQRPFLGARKSESDKYHDLVVCAINQFEIRKAGRPRSLSNGRPNEIEIMNAARLGAEDPLFGT